MTGGLALRTIIQIAYLLILARALGAEQYGAFLAVVALVSILSPFSSMGTGHLLIRGIATERRPFAAPWGDAIAVTSGCALTLGLGTIFFVSPLVLPDGVSVALVTMVVLADLLFGRLAEISAQAYQGFERLERTAQIRVSLAALRLVAVIVMSSLVAELTAVNWSIGYAVSAMVTGIAAIAIVNLELGRPRFRRGAFSHAVREGFYFSLAQSGQQTYTQVDKTMLAKIDSLGTAGVYGAASRIVDASFMPMVALLNATYSRFFRHGVEGVKGTLRFATRLLPLGMGYGALVGIGFLLFAPLLPWILGAEYASIVQALRWLAPIPLLRAVQYFAADSLTGAGYQPLRSAIQIGVGVCTVGINFVLIPRYSWLGAAWASVISSVLMALAFWTAVFYLRHREAREGNE
jgi:O-antigen/teichoic acid export membrane protein